MTKQISKKNKKTIEAQNKRSSLTSRMIFGSLVSSDFIVKHWLKIFTLMLLIMIMISTKYQCQTGMETIKKLSNRLDVVKTERIREHSTYMSRIRESAMQQLADSVMPGLTVQQQPPYRLE